MALATRASPVVIVFLLLNVIALVPTCLAQLRLGAFNIRVFGRSKVADEDAMNIIVKVNYYARDLIPFNYIYILYSP